MAGKWAKLRGKIPTFEHPPDYQARVNQQAKPFRSLKISQLAKEFAKVKRAKYKLEDRLKELNERQEALSQLLVDRLEGETIQSISLKSGVSVYLKTEPYSMVSDRQKLFAWIKATRQASLLSVHFQTLNALVKTLLEEGRTPPPGVSVFLKERASARGLRPGKEDE